MGEAMQTAFETVDSARAHKVELEGKLKQLNECIFQVSTTADDSIKDIEKYTSELQKEVCQIIEEHSQNLVTKINSIKSEALSPLNECKEIIEDDIEETSNVITNGETLLQQGDNVQNSNYEKELKKFNSVTEAISLDSVPEVPLTSEVACISVQFDETTMKEFSSLFNNYVTVMQQSPVQIDEIFQKPGALLITWEEINATNSESWLEVGNSVFYKLQCCHGKANATNGYSQSVRTRGSFKDEYIGKKIKHTVAKLSPNTAYTFRVCQCYCSGAKMDDEPQWSPWSVYKTSMTTMPGYEWLASDGYSTSQSNRLAEKTKNSKQILYSKDCSYRLGYPIHFALLSEGKSRSSSDAFGFIHNFDRQTTSLNLEGSICLNVEGVIFVNSHESHTKFAPLHKGSVVSFNAVKVEHEGHPTQRGHTTLRVTITVGSREAVFDWKVKIPLNADKSRNQCLTFATSFRVAGWKIITT